MNRKEMKQLLEERFERIALLETRIDTMEQLVDGYHAREQSIIDTLHAAQSTAKKLVEEARAESQVVREQACRESEALLNETRDAAQATIQQAEQQALEVRISAKNESDRALRDAEIIKREYEELIDSFNAMLDQNANELRQTAARFAEYVRGRKIEAPEVRLDGEAFYKSVGAMSDAQLPDPSGDPAALMKNIYLLQNRPMPNAEEPVTEDGALNEDIATELPEEQAQNEPYSEDAWLNSAQRSESEPQAEFVPAFDPAYVPASVEIQASNCAVPAEEAEHAFDEYFSAQGFSGAQETKGTASAQENPPAGNEPQAEAEKAFDELFSKSFEPSGKSAQDEVEPEMANGPEGAVPEPYSEKAWAQNAFTSSHEPQAEGALAFDALFSEDTAQEDANRPFEAEDEPREWEPESESDVGEIPTVSKFVPQSDDEEVSLDALLEEIIQAGE